MIEKDENKKIEKFKKCQEQLEKSALKKKQPRNWEQMDDAEKQERQIVYCDDEVSQQTLKRRKDRDVKPDKAKKLQQKQFQVKEYEIGLTRHRSALKIFHRFDKPQKLQLLDIGKMIKDLQQAAQTEQDIKIAVALKKIGIKSMKTLFRGGAKRQINLILEFLKTGKMPQEFFKLHNILLQKKKQQFNGSVKSYLWP